MWFFRLVEVEPGTWACRRGQATIDEHGRFAEAFDHICEIAAGHPPSQVFVHARDSLPAVAARFEST